MGNLTKECLKSKDDSGCESWHKKSKHHRMGIRCSSQDSNEAKYWKQMLLMAVKFVDVVLHASAEELKLANVEWNAHLYFTSQHTCLMTANLC